MASKHPEKTRHLGTNEEERKTCEILKEREFSVEGEFHIHNYFFSLLNPIEMTVDLFLINKPINIKRTLVAGKQEDEEEAQTPREGLLGLQGVYFMGTPKAWHPEPQEPPLLLPGQAEARLTAERPVQGALQKWAECRTQDRDRYPSRQAYSL